MRILLAVLCSAVCVLACRAPVREYGCVTPARAQLDPHEVWDCHRDIALRATRDKEFTLREFERAKEFFERLTGIPASTVDTDFGPVPGAALRESLKRWDTWYVEHGKRLYWDAAAQRVELAPADAS